MTPQVGDQIKADPIEEGQFLFGTILAIEGGLCYATLGDQDFCGDTPTRKDDGVWICDSF